MCCCITLIDEQLNEMRACSLEGLPLPRLLEIQKKLLEAQQRVGVALASAVASPRAPAVALRTTLMSNTPGVRSPRVRLWQRP